MMGRGWQNFEANDRKSLNHLDETVGRNIGGKNDSGDISGKVKATEKALSSQKIYLSS